MGMKYQFHQHNHHVDRKQPTNKWVRLNQSLGKIL